MNIEELEKKLNNCNNSLKNDTSIQDISKQLLENSEIKKAYLEGA